MPDELEALRKEIAALRTEIAMLRAQQAPVVIQPYYVPPSLPWWSPTTIYGVGNTGEVHQR